MGARGEGDLVEENSEPADATDGGRGESEWADTAGGAPDEAAGAIEVDGDGIKE